jgi:hypothetical protein
VGEAVSLLSSPGTSVGSEAGGGPSFAALYRPYNYIEQEQEMEGGERLASSQKEWTLT